VPNEGFFLGAGGNLNTHSFGTQDVYAVGTSDVYNGGVLQSSGSAAGPAAIVISSEPSAGFAAQGGYFRKFADSDWMWGGKFAYSYLDASSTVRNALLPQAGSFTTTPGNVTTPFTGNALVRSYQTHLVQQIALVPFVGRSFDRGFVYAGAGPTLSQTRTDLNGVIGFADINGNHTDVSGQPINLSSTDWVYGGTATVGVTYFLAPLWFVDVNYAAALTGRSANNYFSPFTNPNGTAGSNIVGTLVGNSSGKVLTQGMTLTINRVF
jgi:hypothetical protein